VLCGGSRDSNSILLGYLTHCNAPINKHFPSSHDLFAILPQTYLISLHAKMSTQPQAIPISPRRGGDRQPERTVSLSVSPTQTFHHSPLEGSFGVGSLQRTRTAPKNLKPFHSQDIKILLLENVNQSGKDILSAQGYQVESLKSSLPEDQLIEKIRYRLLPLHTNCPSIRGGLSLKMC